MFTKHSDVIVPPIMEPRPRYLRVSTSMVRWIVMVTLSALALILVTDLFDVVLHPSDYPFGVNRGGYMYGSFGSYILFSMFDLGLCCVGIFALGRRQWRSRSTLAVLCGLVLYVMAYVSIINPAS